MGASVEMNMVEMEPIETVAKDDSSHELVRHDKGLLAIGLFKIVEAVFFVLVGFGVLHLLHRDLSDEAMKLVNRFRVDPEGRLVSFVLDQLDSITSHRLKQIGVATFFYAALRAVEGIGLVREKVWAEYLTVLVTVSFLPWEIYEIAHKPDWVRIGLLIVNLAVLAYLLWWLQRMRTGRQQALLR